MRRLPPRWKCVRIANARRGPAGFLRQGRRRTYRRRPPLCAHHVHPGELSRPIANDDTARLEPTSSTAWRGLMKESRAEAADSLRRSTSPPSAGGQQKAPVLASASARGRLAETKWNRTAHSREPDQAGCRQVFWLPDSFIAKSDLPPSRAMLRETFQSNSTLKTFRRTFPSGIHSPTVAYCGGRHRSQRRVRGRFSRPSLLAPSLGHL